MQQPTSCVLAFTESDLLQGCGSLLLLVFVSVATTTVMGHMEDSSNPDGRELALALQAERSLSSMRPVGNGSSLAGGAALRRACMAVTFCPRPRQCCCAGHVKKVATLAYARLARFSDASLAAVHRLCLRQLLGGNQERAEQGFAVQGRR